MLQRKPRIVVLAGDGIGPEVMNCAMSVLRKLLSRVSDIEIDILQMDAGANSYLQTGTALSEKVIETFSRIDILVNNAGFVIYGKVEELSIEDIESQMQTNYFGTINCTKYFLPHFLKQNSGHMVNVASVGGSFGVPGIASYCATKFAMLGFSEGLHHELHGTNVGVTVVSPIMVRTSLFDHPSFKNFTKFATGISLSADTVANAIIKASDSSRLEIVVPSFVRIGIWFKQTFPFLINPIIGNRFRKQLDKRDS